jgi:alkylation response protein AidB-like acyl-CoA dehydrogenase
MARAVLSSLGMSAHALSPDSDLDVRVTRLAGALAQTAVERDRRGGTAKVERDLIRASGLLALSIPHADGGQGAGWATVMDVVRRLARVDGSLAHLFGFHHLLLATVRLFGDAGQWRRAYRDSAANSWFWGNALNPLDTRTTIVPAPADSRADFHDGWIIDGDKTFCSGASDADRLIVSALDSQRRLVVAAVPTARAGITIHDDWDNMGQRQTDSGSVSFRGLRVQDDEILRTPGPLGSPFASLRPCIAQLVLANVYLGLGQGALDEGRTFTRAASRAWLASSVATPADDPYVLRHYGELWVALEGARALADAAGAALDTAWARGDTLTPAGRGRCALAVATAKVSSARAGLETASRVFEVTGARATAARLGLDRFWRNLRTHTLHDPIDYKLRELGQWALSESLPTPSFYS